MEVQAKLEPLRLAVESQGRTLRSLYSNGSGGPPGYLERARDEDRDWKNQMFAKLDSFLTRLDKVEDFIVAHNATEIQETLDRGSLERRLNVKLTIGGLILAAVSLLASNMASCKTAAKSLLSDPQVNHSQKQNADLPPTYEAR